MSKQELAKDHKSRFICLFIFISMCVCVCDLRDKIKGEIQKENSIKSTDCVMGFEGFVLAKLQKLHRRWIHSFWFDRIRENWLVFGRKKEQRRILFVIKVSRLHASLNFFIINHNFRGIFNFYLYRVHVYTVLSVYSLVVRLNRFSSIHIGWRSVFEYWCQYSFWSLISQMSISFLLERILCGTAANWFDKSESKRKSEREREREEWKEEQFKNIVRVIL